MKIIPGVLLFLGLSAWHYCYAQQGPVYENKVYAAQVKTVQCYNTQKEQSVPVIRLGSAEQLLFSFDDLSGGSKSYAYTIVHCSWDWKDSGISVLDYLDGITEDRMTDYEYSSKTIQPYTHYSLKLPNEQIRPKISGNYLLKVYLDGQPDQLVCTQRFYIVNAQSDLKMTVLPSNEVSLRFSNQKLNITVRPGFTVQNPDAELKLIVMQNADPLTARLTARPSAIKPAELDYNAMNSNDFPGGNEFRTFDFRSLRFQGTHVSEVKGDSILLFPDENRNAPKYTRQIDNNGAFFIRNQDNLDNDLSSDYANVQFSLHAAAGQPAGEAYVTGRFNNFSLNEESKMQYSQKDQAFHSTLLLKQGVYDYRYVWKDAASGKISPVYFEGSFVETENSYQAFLYYRRPGSRWDELTGYQSVFTTQTDTLPAGQ